LSKCSGRLLLPACRTISTGKFTSF